MKTAMQELIEELRSLAFTECHISMGAIMLTQGHIDELEEKYLKKEKDQIISSYNEPLWITGKPNVKAEDYYNQTYNQTNVGNDGFEFDNSSTIPPPKTNNL